MTTEAFTYWLKGFFEIGGVRALTQKEAQVINDHLDLVFKKVTPNREENPIPQTPYPYIMPTPPYPYIIPTPLYPQSPYPADESYPYLPGTSGPDCSANGLTETVSYCAESFRNKNGELEVRTLENNSFFITHTGSNHPTSLPVSTC